jgi:hypothetical protein
VKLKIRRKFCYQASATEVKELQPGVYEVPGEISEDLARKVLRFGTAEVVAEKKAPENKVVTAPENKAKVAKKSSHRRSSRAKPNK